MTFKKIIVKSLLVPMLCAGMAIVATGCSDDDNVTETYSVEVVETMPEGVPAGYTVTSGQLTCEELNTGKSYTFILPLANGLRVPAGTYNMSATMTVAYPGNDAEHSFGLYDTYFTVYNNSDDVQYADGLAIVESKFVNTTTDRILTEANRREANFTVQTVYVIPGSGRDVAVSPGESIKIADQAIDWSAQVGGALDHTDADFEWYDEVTTGTIRDTDNPAVPNLDKWFSYSKTVWLPSNQCNRFYALVRFPEGMTAEKFLSERNGEYQYVNAATGKTLNGTNAYLIDYAWIIDGVNLCTTEDFTETALSARIDAGYAAISDKKADKKRFGRKLVRKRAGVSAVGNTVLMDTDNSASDFEVVSVK